MSKKMSVSINKFDNSLARQGLFPFCDYIAIQAIDGVNIFKNMHEWRLNKQLTFVSKNEWIELWNNGTISKQLNPQYEP